MLSEADTADPVATALGRWGLACGGCRERAGGDGWRRSRGLVGWGDPARKLRLGVKPLWICHSEAASMVFGATGLRKDLGHGASTVAFGWAASTRQAALRLGRGDMAGVGAPVAPRCWCS
ncbi:hypothetical protein M6B38_409675 [Iris pallida]|uniref:Uncharacterized protein n=1 Tax=Iris pallida TaxID=29817 RepID=A0AAX6FNG6_IRIPA|nr:hypothetical protein M6B38_409675 [Iris pallida]